MLNNPMIDVFIGLMLLYLLLSIIVTVAQEVISSYLKLRSRNLQKAIVELIGKHHLKEFYEHPMIAPLYRGGVDDQGRPLGGGPSYIPKRNFAMAVMDLINQAPEAVDKSPESSPPQSPVMALVRFLNDPDRRGSLSGRIKHLDETANDLIDKIANPAVKDAANQALTAATGQLTTGLNKVDLVTKGIEDLFDSAMDRTSGWYKTNAQRISLVLSLALAVGLNADTFFVGRLLWQDEALRNNAVGAAQSIYQSTTGQKSLDAICVPNAAAAGDAQGTEPEPGPGRSLSECAANEVRKVVNQLNPYPIGWPMPAEQRPPSDGHWLWIGMGWLWIGLGWLTTGLAMSLGSGFWFDFLGKFMNIRMAGKRETTASASKT
jgi:hypothetical protein